jgi:hypothetical protein
MSPHIQRTIGKALATALSAYTWPAPITTIGAVYRRMADFDREETEQLRVTVSPGTTTWDEATGMQTAPRRSNAAAVTLNIGITQVVSTDEEIEALEDLGMAIQDAIRSDHFKNDLPAGVDILDVAEVSVPSEVDQRDQFTTNIGVMFGIYLPMIPAPTP